MKTKRILSALMSVVMVFVMFSVLTVFTVTETPLTAKAVGATKAAVYVGNANNTDQNPSCVFIPISYNTLKAANGGSIFSDDTYATFTCKMKILHRDSNTDVPAVTMLRSASSASTGSKTVVTYTGISDADQYWIRSKPTYNASTGVFSVSIRLDNIPGTSNCYAGESSPRQDRTTKHISGKYNADGACVGIMIGNCAISNTSAANAVYNMEFIMSEPNFYANSKPSNNLVSDFSVNDPGSIYSLTASSGLKSGDYTDAANHPFQCSPGTWGRFTTDPDSVKFVTVSNEYLTETRTYTKHAQTDTTREYYTNSDFGSNVYFEKLGSGCYNRISSDLNRKAFIIDSKAGDTSGVVSNIYFGIYTHKGFSNFKTGLSESTSGTNGAEVMTKITFNAKRLSGSGVPALGAIYAKQKDYAYPTGSTWRSSNSNAASAAAAEAIAAKSTGDPAKYYNPSTGEFVAYMPFEKGYYGQTTETGKNYFFTIGTAEHTTTNDSNDSTCYGSSFLITDIKVTVYDDRNLNNVLYTTCAPEMVDDCIDFTTPHKFLTNGRTVTIDGDSKDVSIDNLPLGKFGSEGAAQYIRTCNRTACNAACHALTHYSATNTTREYWRCATCSKNYADPYASEEISTTAATKQVMLVKTTGDEALNAVMPLDFGSSSSYNGDHYYLFTCKMRVFGNSTPTISVMRAQKLGGTGAVTLTDNTNSRSSGSGTGANRLFTNYNASTHTYTAVVKITRKDPKSYEMFGYASAKTGAHNVLLLGNAKNGVSGASSETSYYSGFAFSEPSLKLLTDETNIASVTGDNLLAPLTDKTINKVSYVGKTVDAAGNVTAANNVLEAPIGKYSVQGDTTYVYTADYSDNFYAASPTPRMAKVASYQPTSVTVGFSTTLFCESNTTYQFDMDYRVFGGLAEPNLVFSDAIKNKGMVAITAADKKSAVAASTTNTHLCYRITTREDLRTTEGGNVMIQFGLIWGSCTTSSEYLANITLRKVSGGNPTGENLIPNGDFSLGTLGVIQYDTYAEKLAFYDDADTGFDGSKKYGYKANELMTIPANFFNGAAETPSDSTIALKVTPNANNQYLQFKTQLTPSAYYRLSFKYNFVNTGTSDSSCTMPVIKRSTRISSSAYNSLAALTPTSKNSAGSSVITCDFQVPATATTSPVDAGDSANGNTDFQIDFGTDASTKVFYITEMKLYKLTGSGGSITGTNLIANMNTMLGSSYYTSVGLSSVGSTYNVTSAFASDTYIKVGSSPTYSMGRNYANGWMVNNSGLNITLMKVPSDFFYEKTGATRVSTIRHLILGDGVVTTDNYNPIYDPNGNGTKGDIKDLVRAKRVSVLNAVGD